jgi:hypothetical protein
MVLPRPKGDKKCLRKTAIILLTMPCVMFFYSPGSAAVAFELGKANTIKEDK